MPDDDLLEEQQAYYRARAPEYDEWFLREGRYDQGREANSRWFAEVERLREALKAFRPTGRILEFAAGTGWWTKELLETADRITAVDGSSETLTLNRSRLGCDPRVEYVVADIFDWMPPQVYDVVFFSFWLSHVPADRFAAFWAKVRSALRPGGRVFFIDSLRVSAPPQVSRPEGSVSVRTLKDGSEFRVVKIYYQPDALERDLKSLGWHAVVERTPDFFVFGSAERPTAGGLRTPGRHPI